MTLWLLAALAYKTNTQRRAESKPCGASAGQANLLHNRLPGAVFQMKLSDGKVIEFLCGSPLKSFAAMLDSLRYVDDVPIPYKTESELVDEAAGDDVEEEPKVRVPEIRGIPPVVLLAFIEHAHSFEVLKRRPRMPLDKAPEKISLLYELTHSGRYVVKILEALTDASSLPLS